MIKILEKNVADKIAAGEVIDRPVSIIKELVENSLDAGADSITIEISDGGKTYIRVTDNGCGIDPDQVELAFRRHATSKITSEQDLDTIATLGFRGEALASICAVSRVELITRTEESRTGRRVIIEGSDVISNSATGCPEGTTITVKDLFFNVPARNKFMASAASESRRIIDFASRIALSYPDIRFNVINSSKRVFTTSGKGNILASIISIYGTDTGKDLIPVEKSEGGLLLKGYVSSPGTSLPSRSRQVMCVNGRIISSNVMERAIDRAYQDRLFKGRFPVAFLFLAMPPEKLDVNIHPTKKEIRFDDNAEVEDFIYAAIRDALRQKEAIPSAKPDAKAAKPMALTENESEYTTKNQIKVPVLNDEKFEIEYKAEQVNINNVLETLRKEQISKSAEPEPPKLQPVYRPFEFDELKVIGVIFNTYIAAQDSDSFYLIDQHAAHERVFYEKLTEQFRSSEKAMQQLLLPLNFNVSAAVTASEESWIEPVRSFGYNIEFFGNNTYIVREIPSFMDMAEAEEFLEDIFMQLDEKPDLSNSRVFERIITKSCKSAVKAGDRLDDSEIMALFEQLKSCENPFSCPHGRPTFIKMTQYELERMFKRA